MRKIYSWMFISVLLFSLCACGSKGTFEKEELLGYSEAKTLSEKISAPMSAEMKSEDKEHGSSGQGKILIAYFTWAENTSIEEADAVDAATSASVLLPGNVAQMALWIQEEVGGDLFSIRVREPYPSKYDECLERASDEKAKNARPKLMEQVENLSDYDTIFLGFPNWWYSAPMPVFSFLEENDLSGKKIILFCSHGTGGLASSVRDISSVLQDSIVESNVIGVYREEISSSQNRIKEWLNEIGY